MSHNNQQMAQRSEILTCQQVLQILVFLGFMFHHMLRVNISIAIVEMVAKSHNETITTAPRFKWTEEEKNEVLGVFFWGYILTQVPGGRLSEALGSKVVVGTGLLIASILTILTPIASTLGYRWLVFVRFALGVAMGIHWPSTHPIATRWIPPEDTATFLSHMIASSLGAFVTLPACGYLIAYFGWPSVFYVTGTIALVWVLSWWYFVYDSPEDHPRIRQEEKARLASKLKKVERAKVKTPWSEMLLSAPVWAVIVANTCGSCTFFVAFNQQPTYMSQVLHFDIQQNGWLSSLPFLVRYFTSILCCLLADKLIESKRYSVTTIRKLFTCTWFFGTCCLFIMQALKGYNSVISVLVFTGSFALMGLATSGCYANPIDIAPAYAGTIFGLSQVPGCIFGYVTTKVVALVTREKQDFEQWSLVFWMLVAVNLFAGVFVFVCISGEEQPWSVKSEAKEMKKLQSDEKIDVEK